MQPPGTRDRHQCLDQLAMYLGTVTLFLFALSCATILVASSPISGFEKPNKRASVTLRFEGCFSDSVNAILPNAQKYENSNNLNHDCVDKCAEAGFPISSTKGTSCYCTHDFPLPRLHKANDPQASGTDGPCSTTCPGASIAGTNTPCVGEECCGGPNAYSVYLSGEIDLLRQFLERITYSQTIDFDNIKNECEQKMSALGASGWLLETMTITCSLTSTFTVSASGEAINSNGIAIPRKCTMETIPYRHEVTYTCEDLGSLPEHHVEFDIESLDKIIESEEPINEELATDYDIVNENFYGTTDLTVSKSYQVTTTFSESWSTRHGFSFKITLGVETEVGTIFAKAKNQFELTTGYSFTSTYSKTDTTSVRETFSVNTVAVPGTKVVTHFLKSQAPMQLTWRAQILANGFAYVDNNVQYPKVEGDRSIISLIGHAQRIFYAFGSYDFGDRKMMIARSQTYDINGNLIAAADDTVPVD